MYYIQRYEAATGKWRTRAEDNQFETLLPALEERDSTIEGWPNDGVKRGCRVVNDDGEILDYKEVTID
jgi:hypothetical protein